MLYFIISGGENVVYYIVSLVMNDEPEKQFCPLSTEKKMLLALVTQFLGYKIL